MLVIVYAVTDTKFFNKSVKHVGKQFGVKANAAMLTFDGKIAYAICIKGNIKNIHSFVHTWLKERCWWEQHDSDIHGFLCKINMIDALALLVWGYYNILPCFSEHVETSFAFDVLAEQLNKQPRF